jgi:hypothetical protein
MTVYVDDMKAPFKPKHRPGRTYVMSHMIGTDEAELHAMALACGVARRWYQGDHYDVTQAVRAKAIRKGAIALSRRDLSAMAMLRRYGKPMGDPATAFDRLCAHHGIVKGSAMLAPCADLVAASAPATDPDVADPRFARNSQASE